MSDDLRLPPRTRVRRVRLGTIALSILALITPVIGVVAVKAEVDASRAACEGSNDAKAAAGQIVTLLYKNTQQSTSDPGVAAARAQSANSFLKLRDKFDIILAADEC